MTQAPALFLCLKADSTSDVFVCGVQVYGGDASKLVDVCRQRVVFENMRELLACLHSIAMDQDTVVHRVKDGLSPPASN